MFLLTLKLLFLSVNPTALRKANIVYIFGLSECNRVSCCIITLFFFLDCTNSSHQLVYISISATCTPFQHLDCRNHSDAHLSIKMFGNIQQIMTDGDVIIMYGLLM